MSRIGTGRALALCVFLALASSCQKENPAPAGKIPTPLEKSNPSSVAQQSTFPLPGERLTLPNGLTIITCEDHSVPVASVQVWARTGSIHEGTQMGAGLSHILEHMLFKGTKQRGVADISRQVEAYGGYINAYTSWDRTVYHIDIPSDGGKPGTSSGTEMAIDILSDAMMNSTLIPKEYFLEQKVILRELAMNRDDPDRQASELFFSTVYTTHPSRHPVIGYEDVYRALKREDVLAYYKERYVPNNLLFVVAGNIDTARVRAQITEKMGPYKRRPLPPFFVPGEPPQISPRIIVTQSRTTSEKTRINLGYAGCDFRHSDAAALEILSLVAGNGLSSRLYQSLREQRHLVHQVEAWNHTPSWRGVFGVDALTDPDKADAARQAIIEELENFKNIPITPEELSKALKTSLSSHLGGRKSMSGLASELGNNEFLAGDLEYSERYLAHLRKVTAADVQRVAKTYFTPSTLNVVMLHPKAQAKTPKSPAPVVVEHPIHKDTLANGLTLLTKEDHRLPFVELRLVMRSGLLFEDARNNGISHLVAKLLLKGTSHRTAEELVRQIESVGGSISPYSGSNSMGLSIEVMKSDLPLAVEILSDIVANSTFTDEAITREKDAQLSEMLQEREQPVKMALQNAKARLFGSHPYGLPTYGSEKTLQSLDHKEVMSFWRRVAVPSNMTLAVFGDLLPEQARAQVETHLSSLPKGDLADLKTPPPNFGKADRVIDEQDKEQGVIVIGFPGVALKDPDYPKIELMNAALSGMGSRLFLRLRDELALCYYVGANELAGIDPGFIYFYIGTEMEKLPQAEREILLEIDKIRQHGVSAEELDRARNGLIGEYTMKKQDLGELALTAALDELYGLGYDHASRLEEAYRKTTPQELKDVARKYLSQPAVVSIVQAPGKK